MRRFRFSLDGVLHYRQVLEEKSLQTLGHAMAYQNEAQAELDRSRERHNRLLAWVPAGPVDVNRLLLAETMRQAARSEIEERAAELERRTVETDRCRQDLVAVRRRRRVLEILRERRWQAYRRQALREEQTLLDEMGNSAAARRRLGEG